MANAYKDGACASLSKSIKAMAKALGVPAPKTSRRNFTLLLKQMLESKERAFRLGLKKGIDYGARRGSALGSGVRGATLTRTVRHTRTNQQRTVRVKIR